jgi:hypothetical protein
MSKLTERHFVLGAGMGGCLYDYGPNAHETLESALEAAEFYLGDSEPEDVTDADVAAMRADLVSQGIHYFPQRIREAGYGDYIEVSEHPGPCPESEDY